MLSVSEFIEKYQYDRGFIFLPGWRRIDSDQFMGDCGDFALTVLVLSEGGWLQALWAVLTFKAVFWLVHSPDNKILPRHVVLWHRKHGWIDSTERNWRDTPAPHTRVLPLLFPWSIFRTCMGFFTKLMHWFLSILYSIIKLDFLKK